MYIFGPGHMTKMATLPIYGKKILKIFFTCQYYVTGYHFNDPSGSGCIAHHRFGTVTLHLQKINKSYYKQISAKLISHDRLRAQKSNQDLMVLCFQLFMCNQLYISVFVGFNLTSFALVISPA